MFGGTGTLIDNEALFLLKENIVYFVFAIIISTPLLKSLYYKHFQGKKVVSVLVVVVLMVLFLVSVTYLVKGAYNPFIYFNF
ncbi:MAG TPA: hypothetical protein DEP65_01460 [Ruminococcus sp.]|nr:hypothetical protein [Ruminococcus sp.]